MSAVIRPASTYRPVPIASPQVAEIVTTLRDEIVSGAIAPGAQLGQESLAARFGVSRMPIREAIQHLVKMGFVTIGSNKRSHVAETSAEDFRDIYDMRLALEGLAMRLAMPNLTNAQIDAAEAINGQLQDADAVAFGALNQAFHMTLYRPCQRPRLLDQIDTLFNAADRYLCMAQAPEGLRQKSDAEHVALLEACRRRDAAAAEACLDRHIGDAADLLEAQFRHPSPATGN